MAMILMYTFCHTIPRFPKRLSHGFSDIMQNQSMSQQSPNIQEKVECFHDMLYPLFFL